jgi:hypothetical protein
MVKLSELRQIVALALAEEPSSYLEPNYHDAIFQLGILLKREGTGKTVRFLHAEMNKVQGEKRGRLAYVLAKHYFQKGDVPRLRSLYDEEEPAVQQSVLDALWVDPGPGAALAALGMAIEATESQSPGVRTAACFVIQNQCAAVDASAAIVSLKRLLADRSADVRRQAACAAGNLAKQRYHVSTLLPQLRRNMKHKNRSVRNYSAWAVWQLSRSKHDVAAAVPDLVRLLGVEEENNEHRKNAVGALLHHARKSADNARQVQAAVKGAKLNREYREIPPFLSKLAKLR